MKSSRMQKESKLTSNLVEQYEIPNLADKFRLLSNDKIAFFNDNHVTILNSDLQQEFEYKLRKKPELIMPLLNGRIFLGLSASHVCPGDCNIIDSNTGQICEGQVALDYYTHGWHINCANIAESHHGFYTYSFKKYVTYYQINGTKIEEKDNFENERGLIYKEQSLTANQNHVAVGLENGEIKFWKRDPETNKHSYQGTLSRPYDSISYPLDPQYSYIKASESPWRYLIPIVGQIELASDGYRTLFGGKEKYVFINFQHVFQLSTGDLVAVTSFNPTLINVRYIHPQENGSWCSCINISCNLPVNKAFANKQDTAASYFQNDCLYTVCQNTLYILDFKTLDTYVGNLPGLKDGRNDNISIHGKKILCRLDDKTITKFELMDSTTTAKKKDLLIDIINCHAPLADIILGYATTQSIQLTKIPMSLFGKKTSSQCSKPNTLSIPDKKDKADYRRTAYGWSVERY